MARGSLNAFSNVAASTTDGVLVAAAGATQRIIVTASSSSCGASATTVTFNSKGSGAGTAITGLYSLAANGQSTLHPNDGGWFSTNPGEGLTVTTGAGAAVGVNVVYRVV